MQVNNFPPRPLYPGEKLPVATEETNGSEKQVSWYICWRFLVNFLCKFGENLGNPCLHLKPNLSHIIHTGGVQPVFGKRSHTLLRAGPGAACGKITITYIPNRLNYCAISILFTLFKNVAAGRIIQPGEQRVGNQRFIQIPCKFRCDNRHYY